MSLLVYGLILIGAVIGLCGPPMAAFVLGPVMPRKLGQAFAWLTFGMAQLAYRTGVAALTPTARYDVHAADREEDELVFDHGGEEYRVDDLDKIDRVTLGDFGIVSVLHERDLEPIRVTPAELRQYAPDDVDVPTTAPDADVAIGPEAATGDGELAADGGEAPDRVALDRWVGGDQLWVPREYLSDDFERPIVDFNRHYQRVGQLGDGDAISEAMRNGIREGGPTPLPWWGKIMGAMLSLAMGSLTAMIVTGAV